MGTTSLGLPVSRLINVSVNLAPAAAQGQNLNDLLILGSSTVIDTMTRMRSYSSISAVATDFGTSAPEYLAAALWFEQVPQPTTLLIGRWAKTASSGQLITISQPTLTVGAFTGITTGSFKVTIDGTLATASGLNFSGAANLPAVANIIQTNAAITGKATVVWNATYSRFEFTSATTGTTSSVSVLSPSGSGTDISSLLGGTTAQNPVVAAGLAAETALQAVQYFDTNFGQRWYAVTVLGLVSTVPADATQITSIAAYIESATNYHFYGVSTIDPNVTSNVVTTDIASVLQAGNYRRTAVQYSSTNPYAVVSLLARIMTTNYSGNNTTITLMYKQEPGIAAEVLTSSQADTLNQKNCNVFVLYNNATAIIEYGECCSGDYIDTVMGAAALAVDEQTALYNVLYTSPTKIPQDDGGMHVLGTVIEGVALRYVDNGLIGPGTWLSPGFGTLQQNQWLDKGYYLYIPPISSQSQADRTARKSVNFQLAAKLRGAVHQAELAITFNS